MNLYEIYRNASIVLMSSMLMVSCGDTTETQTQNGIGTGTTSATTTKASGPTVALSSEQVEVTQAESFTLDITMSDFPLSEGGGVSILFDPSLINVNNVVINSDIWTFVNKSGEIDNGSGVVSDILFSSFKGVSGDSPVATVTFTAISSGYTQISLQGSAINPFSSNGEKVAVNYVATNVQIAVSTD